MINTDNILIRCSSLGKISTPPKNGSKEQKNGELGKTAKTYLQEVYKELKYCRKREYDSKYITKGRNHEEDALVLLSRHFKDVFVKNTVRLEDAYFSGEPDTFRGKVITETEEGFDVKCSWDIWTFPSNDAELSRDYKCQNIGYMALTGAKKWSTVNCLVNAHPDQVRREKEKVWYAMGCPETTNDAYIERCIEIEKNMIFNLEEYMSKYPYAELDCTEWKYDIPLAERLVVFEVERNDDEIKELQELVVKSREYIKSLL